MQSLWFHASRFFTHLFLVRGGWAMDVGVERPLAEAMLPGVVYACTLCQGLNAFIRCP